MDLFGDLPTVAGGSSSGGLFDDIPDAPIKIDFDRPVEQVRADVAKLPEGQRKKALDQWADAYVAKERGQGGIGQGIDNTVRAVSRGTFVGPFLDEITGASNAALHAVTGGAAGAPYDETVAYQRAKDRAFDKANPVGSTVAQIGGAVAGGGAATKTGSKVVGMAMGGPFAFMPAASTIKGRIAQGIPMGAAYGGVHGFGNAEGDPDDRLDAASHGALVGAGIGAVAPPILGTIGWGARHIADAASPMVARVGANLSNIRNKMAIKASAGGASDGPGADAAAEQIIANQLARANISAPMLRQRFRDIDEATSLGGGRASNAIAPVDVDPSLQRLAGSVMRQNPEASNIGAAFQVARQTGHPPGMAMPPNAAIPTRAPMSEPGPHPTGQFERVTDALKKALGIDKIPGSAHTNDRDILIAARAEGNKLYGETYEAARGLNLSKLVGAVSQQAQARLIDEPPQIAGLMRSMIRDFNRAVEEGGQKSHLERLDKVKQAWDDSIEALMRKGRGNAVRALTGIKNEYLGALDAIKVNDLGAKYQAARNAYSSRMELRDALALGRRSAHEDSEIVADHFAGLKTDGERNMFRLGLFDAAKKTLGGGKRSADATQMFQKPRVEELMRTVIPAGEVNGVNRAEQFGRFLENERRMIETRNQTLGNSKTAERLADDAALDDLQGMIEQAKKLAHNPSTAAIIVRAFDWTVQKLLGPRADTAAAISRKLFTADPIERERLLQALEHRLGPSRAAHLARLLRDNQSFLSQAAAVRPSPDPRERPSGPGMAGSPPDLR